MCSAQVCNIRLGRQGAGLGEGRGNWKSQRSTRWQVREHVTGRARATQQSPPLFCTMAFARLSSLGQTLHDSAPWSDCPMRVAWPGPR